MNVKVLRYNHDKNSTSGLLFINGKFECYTLEDERREVKVRGETRIPEGNYKVAYQESLTPLTRKYQEKYDWFGKHLHIKSVPNFTGIYIHVGNYEKNTDGCLLVADQAVNDPKDYSSVQYKSTQAYKRIYKRMQAALDSGEEINLIIESE
ncbi:MAG: DUF5675 family protein [Lewinella sp.]|uniref:DUF5675 family protein n=1 Tax=Lewinella sp. TaxID=2004506 RepID=UPI003D6AA8F7